MNMNPKLLLYCLTFIFAISSTTTLEYAPIVQLKGGKVRGMVEMIDSHKVHLYQGIRYGQAKRFLAPQPSSPWSGLYDATLPQFVCPQDNFPVSDRLPTAAEHVVDSHVSNEDCLFLNVWQPIEPKVNRSIMLWIHGGTFISGSAFSRYEDGSYISSAGDVIVVTINYRLGALGFMYGDDGVDAPGNLGLRDMILALQWVKENIEHFGGNPNDVTILGASAGSISVGALLLSPLANGLFHRAILQSGAPNAYIGSESRAKALPKMIALAEKLNCPKNSSHHSLVECLRNQTVEAILVANKNSIVNGESFIPIYGDEVLPIRPVDALKMGKFNHNVDLLFGVNSGEGAGVKMFIPQLDQDSFHLTLDIVKKLISFVFQLFQESYSEEVADFYTKHLNNGSRNDDFRRAVSNSFGDYHLVCPTILFAEQLAKMNPQKRNYYSYRLTHAPQHGCHGWQGVCHSEGAVFMFGLPFLLSERVNYYSKQDLKLSVDSVRAWTQFAKTGNPGAMDKSGWESAFGKGENAHAMQLDPEDYKMIDPHFYKESCNGFWKSKIFV